MWDVIESCSCGQRLCWGAFLRLSESRLSKAEEESCWATDHSKREQEITLISESVAPHTGTVFSRLEGSILLGLDVSLRLAQVRSSLAPLVSAASLQFLWLQAAPAEWGQEAEEKAAGQLRAACNCMGPAVHHPSCPASVRGKGIAHGSPLYRVSIGEQMCTASCVYLQL